MTIDKQLGFNKLALLKYFRSRADECLSELALLCAPDDCQKKAHAINRELTKCKESLIEIVSETARKESWSNSEILEAMLMITYTNDVVMLEARDSVWKYDYMAFSRRIGELWEPFCKLCFLHPTTDISLFIPPLFSEVKSNLIGEIESFINELSISEFEKMQLKRYYDKVWSLVSSGEIKLECDLHFTDGVDFYIVDFKSGFGSNEKGNTNRLLLVGSVYQNIDDRSYKCLMFVRSTDNNHYLSTLRNSGLWNVSCGSAAYEMINKFTGYDIRTWITENVDWMSDFSPAMSNAVVDGGFEKYLIW